MARSEMAEVLAYEERENRSFQLVFLLSGMLAFFINMSQIWCTKVRLQTALRPVGLSFYFLNIP
jgi:hypothetical protein